MASPNSIASATSSASSSGMHSNKYVAIIAHLERTSYRFFPACCHEGCGTCTTVSSTSGTIQSPNYPDDYGTGRDCAYNIVAPAGRKIKLTFTSFNVNGGNTDAACNNVCNPPCNSVCGDLVSVSILYIIVL